VVATIHIASHYPLEGIFYDPSNNYVYVGTSAVSGTTYAISGTAVIGNTSLGICCSPDAVFDSSNGRFYFSNTRQSVSVLTAGNVVTNITSTIGAQEMAFDSDNGYIYVSDTNANTVTVIDGSTNSVVATVQMGSSPRGMAFDSANGYVYVARGGNYISVISGTRVIANVTNIGFNGPTQVAYDSSNGYVYVANAGDPGYNINFQGTVSVISGLKVLATVDVGISPDAITFDDANGNIYVSNFGTIGYDSAIGREDNGSISVISGISVATSLSYPSVYAPSGIVFDSSDGYLYVVNGGYLTTGPFNAVTVFAPTTATSTIPVTPPSGPGTTTITNQTTLSSNLECTNLVISSGATLATNGFSIVCTGTFYNQGVVVAGFAGNGGQVATTTPAETGGSQPDSYGGSGGAGADIEATGNGGRTLAPGGLNGSYGGRSGGRTPPPPVLTGSLIASWYDQGIQGFLAGAGGGAAPEYGPGGSGSYGIYIQADTIVAGSINAQGQGARVDQLTYDGGGGGGGGVILLAYGSGGLVNGTYDVSGGKGGTYGGAGQVMIYSYGTEPPVPPSLETTSSETGTSPAGGTSSGGGIPEFPFQIVATGFLVLLIAGSYLLVRHRQSSHNEQVLASQSFLEEKV
jgi:YVTN family beta-propeller protein